LHIGPRVWPSEPIPRAESAVCGAAEPRSRGAALTP
jgi:hypothetical protein